MGLREVNRSSGMEIVSPMSIFLGSSSGFILAMAFQFFTEPVYHFAMWESVSSGQRTLCKKKWGPGVGIFKSDVLGAITAVSGSGATGVTGSETGVSGLISTAGVGFKDGCWYAQPLKTQIKVSANITLAILRCLSHTTMTLPYYF
jgi:hypothetical protein